MKSTIVNHLRVTPATFWDKLFFDPEYNQALHAALRFQSYEVTTLEQLPGGRTRRVLRAEPPLDVPDLLKRKLSGRIYYVEDGTFDANTQVWSFRNVPSIAPEQVYIGGTIRVSPHAQGAEHVCELEARVSGFGFGSVIARLLEKNTRASYEVTVAFTNRFAEERGWLAG